MTPTDEPRADAAGGSSRGLRALLLRPVDTAWLVVFRMLFGAAVCVSMLRFLAYGWVERFFVQPSFFFKYWGFEWVEPLSAAGMRLLFVVLALCAFAVSIGLLFRLAAIVLTLGLAYFQLIDVSTYLNHYYLAALLTLLLAISPAGRSLSVDAWIGRRVAARRGRRRVSPRWIAAGWLYLFRFQVGVVYTFAGLAKLQSDWLVHAQPLRIWLGASTELPLIGPLFALEGVPLLMSWFGFLFDTTIVLWLSFKRTRPWAYAVVVVFHVMTRVLLPIGMFPVFMVLAALMFFEPDWPRRAGAWVAVLARRWGLERWGFSRLARALEGSAAVRAPLHPLPSSWWQGVGVAVLALYAGLQLLMPLRFLVYGGNVLWHEQGMRYSWRVMVRAKGGGTVFHVTNPQTQQRWTVQPRVYLNDMQESEMSSQPDLILQLAHHIERDFEARGLGPVEVRAESHVALNGRRSAPFIDPEIDLTQIRDGLGIARFVLPAPTQPPTHTRPVL